MKMKRMLTYDYHGRCHKFNYKGRYSRSAVYAASYGAGINTLSGLVGRRRAKSLIRVLQAVGGFTWEIYESGDCSNGNN